MRDGNHTLNLSRGKGAKCTSWHSRSGATTELESRDCDLQSASSHYVTITEAAQTFRCHLLPSPASSLRLMNSNRNNILSQLLTMNTLSNSFSSFVSENTEFQRPSSLTRTTASLHSRCMSVCRCGQGGGKGLTVYSPSSSPVLLLLSHVCISFCSP